MAWRNIWRNRRRTLVTLSGIAFGVMLAVLFTGMADDSYSKMIDLAARMGGGHVTIQDSEYQDVPSLKRTVAHARERIERAEHTPGVHKATPRIMGQAMLATASNSFGAMFIAYDPKAEDSSSLSLLESLSDGQAFAASDEPGIILGAGLSENLNAPLGRKVVYTVTDKSGEIVSGLARVSGIIRTGAPTADAGLALLPIDSMRKTLGYDSDEVTQVAVFLDDQRDTASVAKRLGADLDDAAALTWQETQPDVAGYIAMDSGSMVVFEVIIMILVAAGIFNTLFVSVMERLREFGILIAVGFAPSQLFRLVVWESLFLSVVGLVVSAGITIGPYYYLNQQGIDFSDMFEEGTEVSGIAIEPIIYVDIFPEKLLIIAGLVVLATLLAGLFPAIRAGAGRSGRYHQARIGDSMTTAKTPIVSLHGVTKKYRQGELDVLALRGIDLSVEVGEFMALTGPSGSGKTTALNIIGALDEPTSGDVFLEGRKLGDLSRAQLSRLRRDRIGFVFQAYNLVPVLTAFENAEMVLALQGVPLAERRQRVMTLLGEVGLEGMEHRRPDQLSGGQQQRVAIARAIASNPAVTLADEPTANVDSGTAEKLLSIMEKLNRERGATFIFSTHDPRVMERARRIVHMVDGQVERDDVKG